DAPPASLAALTGPGGIPSVPAGGVVHMVIPPLRLEWLGLRVESSRVQATLSTDDLPRSLLSRAQDVLSSVARTFARIVSVIASRLMDAAARVLNRLPPAFRRALGLLAPPDPVTVHLLHYQFGPVDIRYQSGLSLDAATSSAGDATSLSAGDVSA